LWKIVKFEGERQSVGELEVIWHKRIAKTMGTICRKDLGRP
jgi:hypothetical protein